MTRREEIEKVANEFYKGDEVSTFVVAAQWADKTMIEKSFMWFLKHSTEYIDVKPIGECGAFEFNTKIKDMYYAYKKAMEE